MGGPPELAIRQKRLGEVDQERLGGVGGRQGGLAKGQNCALGQRLGVQVLLRQCNLHTPPNKNITSNSLVPQNEHTDASRSCKSLSGAMEQSVCLLFSTRCH